MMRSSISWINIGVLLVTAHNVCAANLDKPSDVALPIATTAKDHEPSAIEMAMMRTYHGGLLFMQGDLEEAIREFREAIRQSPDSPVPHNNLAMALYLQDHVSEAKAELLIAITLNPSYAMAWSHLGFVLFDHGDPAAAVERWKVGVQLDPSMPSAWGGLAIGLLAMGYVDQAAHSYRQTLRLDSQYADVRYLHQVRRWSPRATTHAGFFLDLLKSEADARRQHEFRM
ncbi:MAG: tetratricopeptide repeat protein [Nitrospirales bacterium]